MTDRQAHPTAHLVRCSEGDVLDGDPGSLIALLADPDSTAGLLTSNRSRLRAGSAGAPPHLHRRSAELLFIPDGRLDVLLGEEIVTLEKGDLLVVAPGLVHAFAPGADLDADVLFVFAPGTARFDYYRLLDRAHRGEAASDEVTDSQERFDNHYAESAVWAAR